jgi:hypothetical protein
MEVYIMQNHKLFKPLSRFCIALYAIMVLSFVAGCTTFPAASSDPVAAIRNNKAMLQYFFSQMPKGGELHNHLTGSVYA